MSADQMSIRLAIAREYHRDARHYLLRYSLLPQQEFDKLGRVKNAVDLYMSAECALKAHVFTGRSDKSALDLYKAIRRSGGHSLTALASMADYLNDRQAYESVAQRFKEFSVSLRYSLDAWETFFPSSFDEEMSASYDETVANADWIRSAKQEVESLVDSLSEPLTQAITGIDVKKLIENQEAMKGFLQDAGIGVTHKK